MMGWKRRQLRIWQHKSGWLLQKRMLEKMSITERAAWRASIAESYKRHKELLLKRKEESRR